MSRTAFKHLSPAQDSEPISGDDPLIRSVFRELRRAGFSADHANIVLNATLDRMIERVTATGQPMSLDDAGALLREQLTAEGITDDKAAAITGQVREAITTPSASDEDLLSAASLTAIETSLTAALGDGRLTEDQWVAIVANSVDAEGVAYAADVARYLDGQGPNPGPHPDAPVLDTLTLTSSQARDDTQATEDTTSHQQEQSDMSTEQNDDTQEESLEQRAKKQQAYSRVSDPRYHERGPAGDLFRQETDAMFEQAYADTPENPRGSSDPGLGAE